MLHRSVAAKVERCACSHGVWGGQDPLSGSRNHYFIQYVQSLAHFGQLPYSFPS